MTRHIHHGSIVRSRSSLAALTCGFIALLGARVFGEVAGNNTSDVGDGSAPVPGQYVLVDLGTLGGPSSRAIGMNDRGSIVGWSEVASPDKTESTDESTRVHAFLWTDGLIQDLGTLGGDWAEARGVNSARQVVGSSLNAAGEQRAFYYYDAMHDLNDLLEFANHRGQDTSSSFVPVPELFTASAINNAGQIIASGTVSTDKAIHGYVLTPIEPVAFRAPTFELQDLGPLPVAAAVARGNDTLDSGNSGEPLPRGFSDSTDFDDSIPQDAVASLLADWGSTDSQWDLDGDGVVGIRDLLLMLAGMLRPNIELLSADDGSDLLDDSGSVPGGTEPDYVVRDLNDHQMIVGAVGDQAFAWTNGIPMLIEVSPAITSASSANAVNEMGQIAGWVMTPAGPTARLWIDGKSIELPAPAGWISEALDVNDVGQAVGWASGRNDGAGAVAYLWTGGQALDLNGITAVKLIVDFLNIEEAVAIDEHQRIAGSFRTGDGRTVASMLVPLD